MSDRRILDMNTLKDVRPSSTRRDNGGRPQI
jgi:hypothetical protein